MRRIRSATLGGALALALLTGACGGGDDSPEDASKTTTTGDSSDDTTADTTADTTDLAGLVGEDCQFLLAGAFVNPLAAAVPGADADIAASAEQLDAIAAKAPAEIRDAMRTLAEGYAAFAEALKDVDLSDPQAFTDPDVLAKLQSIEGVFDADYEAASTAVSEYIDANCTG